MEAPSRRPLLAVAHRAGNDLAALYAALAANVDLIETDVHLYRGRIEMRHLKTFGPLLWDRWVVLRRRDVTVPSLAQVLDALDGNFRLMLDLKGIDRGLVPAVSAELAEVVAPITICTKHWWMLSAFDAYPHVRQVLSASSAYGLRRLRAQLPQRSAFGVSVRRQLLTPQVVAEMQGSVQVVLAWPVDTPAALDDARRLGVDGIISKNLDLLREVVAER